MTQAIQNILVIEDESSIRDIIQEMLEDENFKVTCAENGQVGLELAKQNPPDLIICDIMMPLMHGYDVLSHLRSFSDTAIIPFIFLTAKADKSNLRIGMNLGADDYLTKPFTRSELIYAVKSRLEKQAGVSYHYNQKLEDLRKGISSTLPHELLSPLSGLVGLSEYLSTKYDSISPDELLEIAQFINKSAWRFDRVVQNTLLYARLALRSDESQPLADLQETCDYALLVVRDTAEKIATSAKRNKDLRFKLEEVHVCISMRNLKKIVEELVDNACKFSPAETPIQVSLQLAENNAVLQVQDQGYGMQSIEITNIGAYKRFDHQANHGSGLGLTIVQQLVELYKGEFNIESVSGEGTQVQIKLPAQT